MKVRQFGWRQGHGETWNPQGSVRHSAEQSRSAKLISICFHNLNKGELLDKG